MSQVLFALLVASAPPAGDPVTLQVPATKLVASGWVAAVPPGRSPNWRGQVDEAKVGGDPVPLTPLKEGHDLYLMRKGGKPVLLAAKWQAKAGAKLDLDALVGVVYVRGDDLPRAGKVVLTAPNDPGPDEKGHTPIQEASDYKTDMLVPPGFYAVWVKPDNGTRAQKVEDKVRVFAGKTTQVPE